MTDPRTSNAKVIEEFRANAGRVDGDLATTTLVLLHHIGARSGIERVTPVAASLREDGRFVIVASNGGSSTHPAWYHNLKASPRIKVELGTEMFSAVAQELEGPARAEVWPILVAEAPQVGEFQSRAARLIPIFTVTREWHSRRLAPPLSRTASECASHHDRSRVPDLMGGPAICCGSRNAPTPPAGRPFARAFPVRATQKPSTRSSATSRTTAGLA